MSSEHSNNPEDSLDRAAKAAKEEQQGAASEFIRKARIYVERMTYRLRLRSGSLGRDDLIQETLLAALESLKSYDPKRRVLVWLQGILKNKHRDRVRAKYQQQRHPGRETHGVDFSHVEARQEEPVEQVLGKEQEQRLRTTINEELDELDKHLVYLKYEKRLEAQAIQDVLKSEGEALTVNAIHLRLSRIRKKLRNRIGESN